MIKKNLEDFPLRPALLVISCLLIGTVFMVEQSIKSGRTTASTSESHQNS